MIYSFLALGISRDHPSYTKFSKCSFAVPGVVFLGCVVSIIGVKIDPKKL